MSNPASNFHHDQNSCWCNPKNKFSIRRTTHRRLGTIRGKIRIGSKISLPRTVEVITVSKVPNELKPIVPKSKTRNNPVQLRTSISNINRHSGTNRSWVSSRNIVLATILPKNKTLRSTGAINNAPMQPDSISCTKDLPSPSTPLNNVTIQITPGRAVRNISGSLPMANWKTSRARIANKSMDIKLSLRCKSISISFQTRIKVCRKNICMKISGIL